MATSRPTAAATASSGKTGGGGPSLGRAVTSLPSPAATTLVRGTSFTSTSSLNASTSRAFAPGPPSAPPPSITSSSSTDGFRSRAGVSPANGSGASESGSGDAFMGRLAKLGGLDIKSSVSSSSMNAGNGNATGVTGDDEETIRKREHQRMIIGMMGEEAANAEEKKFQLLEREALVIPQFSKALEAAIQEVVPSESALDRPNFDAVDYINAEFPDEKSLTGAKLDATLTLQRQHMLTLSETIAKEVRDHSTQKSRTRKAIKSATNSIKDLVSKIKHIKEKADQSEKMVLQISTDLRSLDCAKKHLTRASQALRNLHMLTSLSSLLEAAINERRYRDAAGQMQGVTVVVTEFEKYKDVANIRSLISHVDLMKERARTQITKDFYNMGIPGSDGQAKINAPLLLDACGVLDALGGDAKASILKWFCKSQLESYQKEYRPSTDAGMLENVGNRFASCMELLDKYDRLYAAVFPRNWDVPAILAREFSIITRDHLTILLKQAQPEVEVFRQIVGKTVDFETTMCLKFREAKIGDVSIHFETSDDSKAATINALKMKYKKVAAVEAAADGKTGEEKKKDDKAQAHVSNIVFEHIISEVFTPYMAILVEWEKHKLDQLISKWRSEEKWPEAKADSLPGALRLTSSNELFLYIRNSIKRITKLARDQTFFQMFRVYRSGISSYVDMLDGRLPSRGSASRAEEKPCGRGELQQMCVIVNTAEYCYDTLPPFGESVRKQVDDVFKNDVDLEQQRQEFNELIGKVLNALANSVSIRLQRALTTMLSMKWNQIDTTGDQSAFVTEIQASLMEDVGYIGSQVVARKHAIFCSSWVRSFVPKFVESIFKIKGITEMGGNQLLLDVTVLRKVLLEAPFVAMSEETKAPSRRAFILFNKYVTEEMLKVENLLKVVNSPNERIVLRFKTMLTHMKPEDLAKIMTVKGLKKPYMVQLINDYNRGVPETERLVVDQVLPPSSAMSRLVTNPLARIKFP